MLKKFFAISNKYVTEKMENPESMLQRMLGTSSDIEKSTHIIKRTYLVLYVILGLGILQQLISIWFLRSALIPGMPLFFLLGIFVGVFLFIISTNYEYFNFWNRKRYNIITIIIYMSMTMASLLALVFCELLLPIIFLIPIGRDVTMGMVVWLSRLLYSLFVAIPAGFILYQLIHAISQPENWEAIDAFKIRKHVDLRKNKGFLYDLNIIRRMEDGRYYTIKEVDRQRHMILNGVTGTGKTSSGLIPAVTSDLDQKAENEDYVKKELVKRMLTEDDIHPSKDISDEHFTIDAFWAEGKTGKDFLEALKKKAPSAGITVIAPNADFADAVYELATIRGFSVNRVDPIPLNKDTGEMKPGYMGFNPLYISPDLSPFQRKLDVFRKSRMFSDVLQALYEQSGKTDQYFTSLNRNLTTTLSILIMITYPWLHNGAQPDMTAIQEVINDFSCVRQYIYALAKIVGVGDELKNEYDVTYDWLKGKKFGEYQFIVSQIAYDLMGAGRVKMEDQARGLRIIINEFLTEPLVRNVVCAKDSLDIDRALAKGEITVVNYGLELGMSIATGFGLFFCLSFNQAVLRRPGNEASRLLHLYYCDELPVLLHKDMEPIFTLFRQFKVCFICAFQTSSQFDRNDMTRYLKNVVISNCGHHIIYGNCSKDDMELYQSLAGRTLKFMEQETVSETALSSANTAMSFSTRVTPQYENLVEGYKIRNKDFQEVTVFGVDNGDHVDPFDGKLSFLTKEQKEGKGRCHIDWNRFISEDESQDATFTKTFVNYTYEGDVDVGSLLMKADLNYLQNAVPLISKDTPDIKLEEPAPAEEEDLSDY